VASESSRRLVSLLLTLLMAGSVRAVGTSIRIKGLQTYGG
jgi:hypothetical protein